MKFLILTLALFAVTNAAFVPSRMIQMMDSKTGDKNIGDAPMTMGDKINMGGKQLDMKDRIMNGGGDIEMMKGKTMDDKMNMGQMGDMSNTQMTTDERMQLMNDMIDGLMFERQMMQQRMWRMQTMWMQMMDWMQRMVQMW